MENRTFGPRTFQTTVKDYDQWPRFMPGDIIVIDPDHGGSGGYVYVLEGGRFHLRPAGCIPEDVIRFAELMTGVDDDKITDDEIEEIALGVPLHAMIVIGRVVDCFPAL